MGVNLDLSKARHCGPELCSSDLDVFAERGIDADLALPLLR